VLTAGTNFCRKPGLLRKAMHRDADAASQGNASSMDPAILASEIEPEPGPLGITYWAWAVGTPFVKIDRTKYQPRRDGRWKGKAQLALDRLNGRPAACTRCS
jgi:hypothetical protein